MKNKNLKIILTVAASINLFYALAYTMYSTLLPSMMNTYNLTGSGMSLLDIAENVGSCMAMLFTMAVADRFSKGKTLSIALILFAGTALLIGSAPAFVLFLVLRVSLGMFGCYIDTVTTAYISDMYPESRGRIMTIIHTFYSFGSMVAPVGVAYLLKIVPEWQTYYLVIGAIMAALGIFFLTFTLKNDKSKGSSEAKEKVVIPYKEIFTNKLLIIVLIACFLMSGDFYFRLHLPTFLLAVDPDKFPLTLTTVMVSLYSFGSIFGKLGYAAIASKVKSYNKLWTTLLAAAALLLSAIVINSVWYWYFAMTVAGFLNGSNFSVKFQMACEIIPEWSATASSAVAFCNCLGNILFSWICGKLGDVIGFGPTMYIAPLVLVFASLLVLFGYKKYGSLSKA